MRLRDVAALGAASSVLLVACSTGSDAVDTSSNGRFRFVSATAQGQLIPAATRKPAADFHGDLIGGGGYSLGQDSGKVVVINFWASWCGPCVLESPMLDRVYRETKTLGVDFVGIDIKDERQAAEAFVHDKHISYHIVYDEPAKTALQLGIPAAGLPVTAVIDRRGLVAAVYIGAVHYPDIDPVVKRLAAES